MSEPISLIYSPGGTLWGVYVGELDRPPLASRFFYAETGENPGTTPEHPPHLCRAFPTGLETR